MESTMDTMTEHARALEDAAMERHRLRMERSQETLRAAMHDTVAQIKRDTVSTQVTQQTATQQLQTELYQLRDEHAAQLTAHQKEIQQLRDEHMAQLTAAVTQATAHVEQLRQQVDGRLHNGTLVKPPEPTPPLPTHNADTPQPASPPPLMPASVPDPPPPLPPTAPRVSQWPVGGAT